MATIFSGRVENRNELAVTLGLSVVAVDDMVRSGCPVVRRPSRRGEGWQFNTADVIRWREQRIAEKIAGTGGKADAEEFKRRKTAAEAGLAELDLEERRGSLAPVAEQRAYVAGMFATTRERILAVPGQMSGDLDHDQSNLLIGRLHDALDDLSQLGDDAGLPGGPEDGVDDPSSATPSQPDRMGGSVPVRGQQDQRRSGKVENKFPARRVRPHGSGDGA